MEQGTGIWAFKTTKRNSSNNAVIKRRIEVAKIPGRDMFTCIAIVSGEIEDQAPEVSFEGMMGWLGRLNVKLPEKMITEMASYKS